VWPPTHRNVFSPFHSLDERLGRRCEWQLVICYSYEAKISVKSGLLLHLKQELSAWTNERAVVRQGIGRPVLITQAINNDA
jgi:hypothetical protein